MKPVVNPASLFLTQRKENQPAGVACTPVFEGSRVFLVEIQALTVPAKASVSRIYSEKIDSGRVARVAAVIEKRCGLAFSDQDIDRKHIYEMNGIITNYAEYDTYYYEFSDTMGTGLTYNNDAAVYAKIGNDWYDITEGFDVSGDQYNLHSFGSAHTLQDERSDQDGIPKKLCHGDRCAAGVLHIRYALRHDVL